MDKILNAAGAIPKATMTIPEACQYLGIGRNSGYEAAASGKIPTIRIGKRILVPRAALERLLADAGTAA